MIVTLSSLLIASPATNRGGTFETEDPPEDRRGDNPNYRITRNAYDSDDKVWSDATTTADQSPFGHSVSTGTNVYSANSIFLKGTYTVSATLNQDWVHPDRQWDGRSGEWNRILNRSAYTGDHDWAANYVPRDTIEYCLADGNASARDIRNSSKRWRTSVYIPW